MREIFKEPTTWILIVMIIGISFIGGLEQKKTAGVMNESNDRIEIVNK